MVGFASWRRGRRVRLRANAGDWWRFQEELAALREKVEKLEKENTVYKHENDKLESKVRVMR